MALIQWNTNGFYSHLGELKLITAQIQPIFICIQETRFKGNQTGTLKGYTTFHKNRLDAGNASGGVAILAKNNYHAEEITLQTDLEAVAISTFVPQKITICNIYLPPNKPFSLLDMHNLIQQLPSPYLIVGDFNSHNALWGSKNTDRRGRIIEDLVSDQVILLNEGTPTHFCVSSGNLTCIDLSLCTASLAPNITWEVLQQHQGSNHFPIKIDLAPTSADPPTNIPQWNMNKADWDLCRKFNHFLNLIARI